MHSKILLLLVATTAIQSALSTDWEKYLKLKKTPCETTGMICSDNCTQILNCFQTGEEPKFIHTCNKTVDGHAYCRKVANGVSCSSDAPECGSSVAIKCGGFGEFPHPVLPMATVRCNEDIGSDPIKICYCPVDYFVDAGTIGLPCNLTQVPLDYKPVSCQRGGQHGTFVGTYCYTCSDEGIYVYGCGETLNGNVILNSSFAGSKNCIPWSSSTPTIEPPKVQCHFENELIPDSEHCHCYYRCDANLEPHFRTCPEGHYFNHGTCLPGGCDD